MTDCPICWHPHMDYDDESCVSCGCDWVFIRDRYNDGMKQRLVAAMFPDLKVTSRADLLAELEAAITAMPVCVSTGDDLFDNLPLEDWNKDMFLMLDRAAVLDLIRKAGKR